MSCIASFNMSTSWTKLYQITGETFSLSPIRNTQSMKSFTPAADKALSEPVRQRVILRPMDGTFRQDRPLDRLRGEQHCYSFDLKSATDRWPLLLLFEVVQYCFGRAFASSVVNSALALNVFEVPWVRRRNSSVSFVAGQPLGYLSSLPLFALSHHVLVWHCAQQVNPGRYFDRYAILGDDIVIADQKVASLYEATVGRFHHYRCCSAERVMAIHFKFHLPK